MPSRFSPVVEWLLAQYASYPVIGILFALITIDLVTGLTCGLILKQLSSKVSFVGMIKKSMLLMVVAFAGVIEQLQSDGPTRLPLMQMTAGFFCITESLSILENAKLAGIPLPPFLSDAINNISKRDQSKAATPSPQNIHVTLTGGSLDATTTHGPGDSGANRIIQP